MGRRRRDEGDTRPAGKGRRDEGTKGQRDPERQEVGDCQSSRAACSIEVMTNRLPVETEQIPLVDGWIGEVLIRSDALAGQGNPIRWPDGQLWRPALEAFLADRTELPGYELLKFSKTGEVCRLKLDVGGRSIDAVCKQSRPAGMVRATASRFQRPREQRNFDRALDLLRAGISTALPLAVLRRNRPARQSWLITEYLPGLVEMQHLALSELSRLAPRACRARKNALIQSAVELLGRLEDSRVTHRDFKAANLMLERAGNDASRSADIILVDLDGLGPMRLFAGIRRWHPVVRLAASLLDCKAVTRTDLARLIRTYLVRLGQPKPAWKTHFRRVAIRAEKYAYSAARRKQGRFDG